MSGFKRSLFVLLAIVIVSVGLLPVIYAQNGSAPGVAPRNVANLFFPLVAKDDGPLPPIIPKTTNVLPEATTALTDLGVGGRRDLHLLSADGGAGRRGRRARSSWVIPSRPDVTDG